MFEENNIETRAFSWILDWHIGKFETRLLLPPIQRSAVWRNKQIIDYWDSLLRGYPAGTMLVHAAGEVGRDEDGKTCKTADRDYQLFDGQQRLTAILLGFGRGQLKSTHRLWVDLGQTPHPQSGLLFALRMSSTGQPFGYSVSQPNEKLGLKERGAQWKAWMKTHKDSTSRKDAFEEVTGRDVVSASCAVPLAAVLAAFLQGGRDGAYTLLQEDAQKSGVLGKEASIDSFVGALDQAMRSELVIQRVNQKIVGNAEEYIRFFERLGQGGTRLSDDELTYSIIKYHYPHIHDRIQEILRGDGGRLASEVNLVLAALRVAKVLVPHEGAKLWEQTVRPLPAYVAQLQNESRRKTRERFFAIIPLEPKTAGSHSPLEAALIQLRTVLLQPIPEDASHGFSPMLLARLPTDLLDVLLLLALDRRGNKPWATQESAALQAFGLYWLCFVENPAKAATRAYELRAERGAISVDDLASLIRHYEEGDLAWPLPIDKDIETLKSEARDGTYELRTWSDRFSAADNDNGRKPGQALRILSTNDERIRCALMWLQGKEIRKGFPHYDPTSLHDEDLPLDLDHLIPKSRFNFDWRERYDYLYEQADVAWKSGFRERRSTVGNSLGNLRWFDASKNRSRNNGPISEAAFADWDDLITAKKWTQADIATFQRLIDLRTLDIYQTIADFIVTGFATAREATRV
jgi:hypothetical protein